MIEQRAIDASPTCLMFALRSLDGIIVHAVGTERLYRTEGIVVRRRNQGEADRVLTLCAPLGKLDVVAKGARKVRSRKAGHIELFCHSSFVVARSRSSWDIVSQVGGYRPVFPGFKSLDGAFPFTDNPHGNRLYPAGAEPALNFAPQKGRYLVADKPVEDPASLLGFVLGAVEFSRCGDGLSDGVLGKFVKKNPVKLAPFFLENLGRMPGNRFALPVRVRGQEDVHGVSSGFF